jgi:ribonuclease HI
MSNYKLYFDGACSGNPGPGGAGVVIVDQYGITRLAKSFFLGPDYTSNRAEYSALLLGLKLLNGSLFPITDLEIISDSKLVVEQVRGNYKVRDATLQVLHSQVMEQLATFTSYKMTFMPRKYNRYADYLARKPLEGK